MHVAEEIREPFARFSPNDLGKFSTEFPKLLYLAVPDRQKLHIAKEEKEFEIRHEPVESQPEIGLPPQPTGYLRYTDHDLL